MSAHGPVMSVTATKHTNPFLEQLQGIRNTPRQEVERGFEAEVEIGSNFARKLAMKQYNPSTLTDPEQVHLLRVFVEEVGLWIDSIDPMRHVRARYPEIRRLS